MRPPKHYLKMFTFLSYKTYIKNALIKKQTKQHGLNRSKNKRRKLFFEGSN